MKRKRNLKERIGESDLDEGDFLARA